MSDYMVTDTELTAVADAIRTKGGTQEPIEWYSGFVDAIDDISTSGNVEPDGTYPDMTVGGLMGEKMVDQEPYLFRPSFKGNPYTREQDTLVGGSLVWNQLIQPYGASSTDYGVTITFSDGVYTLSGTASRGYFSFAYDHPMYLNHIYYTACNVIANPNNLSITQIGDLNGTSSTSLGGAKISKDVSASIFNHSMGMGSYGGSGTDLTGIKFQLIQFDLTAMFGSTIADYVYSLEQATAGAGVAWFKKLFPKSYYEYNPGELMSVKAASHVMTGFNQWDEEWEVGSYSYVNGTKQNSSANIRNKNKIPVIPNTTYYISNSGKGAEVPGFYVFLWYDKDENYLSYSSNQISKNSLLPVPENAHYLNFYISTLYGTTYTNDICINLHWDGERDGEYEPYKTWSYPFDDTLELRGIPKLNASNQLYYDGDTYESDGTVTRKMAVMTNQTGAIGDTITLTGIDTNATDIITSAGHLADVGTLSGTTLTLTVALTDATIVYPLATPTTEEATPFQNPQIVDDWGTEEYTDTRDVQIPVGHYTEYPADLVAKANGLPWDLSMIAPIENGTTASQAYTSGKYFIKDNQFCKALTSISSGATFTLNTNYAVTTVAAELYAAINS